MHQHEPRVDEALAIGHGLKPAEYQRFVALLGRTPTFTELGIVSAMWNEHCSYKSSRLHLKGLPTKAPWVIQGPGENAGVIDIGDGQAVVFKMESHNHPSYIEPYQGATTGVGGILRDVFTMGARPIACLNALSFGAPEHPKTRHLVSGVVAGVGWADVRRGICRVCLRRGCGLSVAPAHAACFLIRDSIAGPHSAVRCFGNSVRSLIRRTTIASPRTWPGGKINENAHRPPE